MERVIEYNESFVKSGGGFIDPSGDFILTRHATYCNNYFSNTPSNKEQFKLIRDFIKTFKDSGPHFEESAYLLLTQYLRYDVVSNYRLYNFIITTCGVPSLKYYNYLLMDFDVQRKPFIVREGKRKFNVSYEEINDEGNRYLERVTREEIESIKQDVPIYERKLYFK